MSKPADKTPAMGGFVDPLGALLGGGAADDTSADSAWYEGQYAVSASHSMLTVHYRDEFFKDNEVLLQIDKDVLRLHPETPFFTAPSPNNRRMYACSPCIWYTCPLYYTSSRYRAAPCTRGPGAPVVREHHHQGWRDQGREGRRRQRSEALPRAGIQLGGEMHMYSTVLPIAD